MQVTYLLCFERHVQLLLPGQSLVLELVPRDGQVLALLLDCLQGKVTRVYQPLTGAQDLVDHRLVTGQLSFKFLEQEYSD